MAKQYFGAKGLYGLAAVAGLADLDAITISTLQMGGEQAQIAGLAWRMILLASLSNLVFKTGVTGVLGTRKLFGWTATLFGAALVAGAVIFWLWPNDEATW